MILVILKYFFLIWGMSFDMSWDEESEIFLAKPGAARAGG